ncbi:hypothetical protein WKV53_02060 [Luteolibacter sp. Y139]|uniref:Type II secretion system protein GspG C-terminal domain-containing protein n=1 Tax=Luteolibacter soli TaxID=3135280 RepID=A0ABU9ARF5_9BACT
MRTAVIGLTLVALTTAIYNWWAAGQKKEAIARARAAGLPLTVEEFTAGMPPDEQNFARRGIVGTLEDEYAVRSNGAVDPASAKGRFQAVGDYDVKRALNRKLKDRDKPTDFSMLPDDGAYGKTPGSFLKEFDRRHSGLIGELQANLNLPYSRRRFVPEGFRGGVALVDLNEGFGLDSRRFVDGMLLRAEAALLTGDSVKATESLEMIARMAETVGSRGTMVSVLVEFVSFRSIHRPLKLGIQGQQWTAKDLERVSAALSRCDLRDAVKRGIESEVLMAQVWEGLNEDRKRFSPKEFSYSFGGDNAPVTDWILEKGRTLIPSGFFDQCATGAINRVIEGSAVAKRPETLTQWWKEAEKMSQAYESKGKLGRLTHTFPGAAVLLKRGTNALVNVQLDIAACEIERFRLEHGHYPESLDQLPNHAGIDPLHGTPFRYEKSDQSFHLYSIGPDGVDDGGKEEQGAQIDQKDWIW